MNLWYHPQRGCFLLVKMLRYGCLWCICHVFKRSGTQNPCTFSCRKKTVWWWLSKEFLPTVSWNHQNSMSIYIYIYIYMYIYIWIYMEVSWNRGTPKSSIYSFGFSLINHPMLACAARRSAGRIRHRSQGIRGEIWAIEAMKTLENALYYIYIYLS